MDDKQTINAAAPMSRPVSAGSGTQRPHSAAGRYDHEASTSAAGGSSGREWGSSPASTSTQQDGVERTLSELAFSRFRNNMRIEARRSSARKSLLGRLGAVSPDEVSTYLVDPLQQQQGQVLGPSPLPASSPGPGFSPSPEVLRGVSPGLPPGVPPPSTPGVSPEAFPPMPPGVLPGAFPGLPPPGVPVALPSADEPLGEMVSAFERFARQEFAEHKYGVGKLIWKKITVNELMRHSRVTLRAPLLRSLAASPLAPKASTVFAHLKAYMEDFSFVDPSDIPQHTFLDELRVLKATFMKKLEPIRLQFAACRLKLSAAVKKVEKKLHIRLFVSETRLWHLQQILLIGIKYEELRDEIYCQVCKQTTYNSARVSNARGWLVMAVCLATFPPSEKFRAVLQEHLTQVAAGLGVAPGDADKGKEMSPYCLGRLHKIALVGSRHVPLSSDDIYAAEHMQSTPISVTIPGGTPQVIALDSMVTGGEVSAEIAATLGLEDASYYGIFVVINGVERYAGNHNFILEAFTQWNIAPLPVLEEELEVFRKTRHFCLTQCATCLYNMDPDSAIGKDLAHGISVFQKEQEKVASDEVTKVLEEDDEALAPEIIRKLYSDVHLVFKKNLFPMTDDDNSEASTRARAFEYAQATHDVVSGLYVLDESDAVTLAALQLRAEHGSSADLDRFLTLDMVPNYGPKEYVTGFEKAWRHAILKKVATLPWEVDVSACRKDYLNFLRSRCPLYGSSWFHAVPKACPQLPREIYLLLNVSGVYFVDVPMKEQLLYLRYIEICSWGYSETSFSLVTGNMSYNMEFRLGTRNGKEISHTLQYFVNHQV